MQIGEPLPSIISKKESYPHLPHLTLRNYKQISQKSPTTYHPFNSNCPHHSLLPQLPLCYLIKATTERPDSLPTQIDFSSTPTSTPTYHCFIFHLVPENNHNLLQLNTILGIYTLKFH